MSDEAARSPAQGGRRLLWAAEISRLLLGFTVLTLLTRTVAPEVLGAYLSVTSVALLAPRLLDAGLPHALGYFLRIAPESLRSCAVLLIRHVAAALVLAAAVAFCLRFVPFASEPATALTKDHWLRLAVLMTSELLILLALGSYIPTGRFKAYLFTALASPAVFIACLLAWPPNGLDSGRLLDLLLGSSLAGSCVAAATLTQAAWRGGRSPFPGLDAYAYGLRSYGSALGKIAAQRFDRLFLVTVLGAAGYAHYSLAISMRDVALFPANLHATTVRNQQIDLVAHADDLAGARTLLCKVSFAWLVIGIFGAAILYTLWTPLIQLAFGIDYLETARFLRIVSFSCAPMAIMGFAWNHLYAMKRPGRVTILTWASLLLALPVFLLLIHLFGPTLGVATAVVAWSALTALLSFAWAAASKPLATSTSP